MLWGLRFHKEIKKEIFENLLVPNCNRYSFDIWYVASSRGPLPSLFIWCPWGQNWPCPGGHKLEHKTEERKFQNSSLKLESLGLSYLEYSISLWTSTKFVHMIPLGIGLVLPWVLQVGPYEQRRQISFFFLKVEGLSFDNLYVASLSRPLPSLYIWCSWAKKWPSPTSHKLEHRNKDSKLQNYSQKVEGMEPWYLVCSISLWTSTKFVHMMPLWLKLALPRGSQDGT